MEPVNLHPAALELLSKALAKSNGYHTPRARRRAMDRALKELTKQSNKERGDSLDSHDD